jgi:hypothetical protein
LQVSSCVFEADDDDENEAAAAGAVFKMLKDYSDFFDAMKAASAATDDVRMQPFVAWCVAAARFDRKSSQNNAALEGIARHRSLGQPPRAAA